VAIRSAEFELDVALIWGFSGPAGAFPGV